MGYYVQVPANLNKAEQLIKLHGGQAVGELHSRGLPPITAIDEIPEGKILVIVVENGFFDAAGIIYGQRELDDFTELRDLRPKSFILLDRDVAINLNPAVEKCLEY